MLNTKLTEKDFTNKYTAIVANLDEMINYSKNLKDLFDENKVHKDMTSDEYNSLVESTIMNISNYASKYWITLDMHLNLIYEIQYILMKGFDEIELYIKAQYDEKNSTALGGSISAINTIQGSLNKISLMYPVDHGIIMRDGSAIEIETESKLYSPQYIINVIIPEYKAYNYIIINCVEKIQKYVLAFRNDTMEDTVKEYINDLQNNVNLILNDDTDQDLVKYFNERINFLLTISTTLKNFWLNIGKAFVALDQNYDFYLSALDVYLGENITIS